MHRYYSCLSCGKRNRWDNTYCIVCGEDNWRYGPIREKEPEVTVTGLLEELTKKLDALTEHVLGPLQVDGKPTREERFLERICQIIDACDYGRDGIARVVARDVAESILKLFDPAICGCDKVGAYEYYRVQAADGTEPRIVRGGTRSSRHSMTYGGDRPGGGEHGNV